jgi:hypothetical protein
MPHNPLEIQKSHFSLPGIAGGQAAVYQFLILPPCGITRSPDQ